MYVARLRFPGRVLKFGLPTRLYMVQREIAQAVQTEYPSAIIVLFFFGTPKLHFPVIDLDAASATTTVLR